MITTVFKKSNIISYVIGWILLVAAVVLQTRSISPENPSILNLKPTVFLFLLTLCMFLIDIIVKQQKWADKSSYHLFLFPLFVSSIPLQQAHNLSVAGFFFFFLGITFFLSEINTKNNHKQVFDASFLMCFSVLFFPELILFYPFLWIFMLFHGKFSFSVVFISLLPAVSIYLLDEVVRFFFPITQLIPTFDLSNLEFSSMLHPEFSSNLWWIILVLLFLISFVVQMLGLKANSANYRSGIFSVYLLGASSLIFALMLNKSLPNAWLFFCIILAAFSTRIFEKIKSLWLVDLILIGIALALPLELIEKLFF